MINLNKRGFTLIELLAVITLIGILMLLAIPSVSSIVENFRTDTFVTNAKTYANAAKKLWTSDGLYCGSEPKLSSTVVDGDYYILIDTTDETLFPLLESGGKSPWGNRDVKGYIRIKRSEDGKKTKYYVALTDGIHAIYDDKDNPVEVDLIKGQDVIRDITADVDKLKNIQTVPFERGKYTTCSEESLTWTGVPIKVINGSGTEVGNEICIEDECFYVISSNENNVTMLAKYNLYVAGEYLNTGYSAYGELATGKQDSTMNGYDGDYPYKGTVPFSSSNYWHNASISYPSFVYNSNSNVYQYVENYKNYLLSLGVNISDARLISKNELIALGCSFRTDFVNYGICGRSAPSWVYSSSYWTGNADDYQHILHITYRNYFISSSARYRANGVAGVRPVIVIPKSEIA